MFSRKSAAATADPNNTPPPTNQNLPPVGIVRQKSKSNNNMSPALAKPPTITVKPVATNNSRPSTRSSLVTMDPNTLERELETLENAKRNGSRRGSTGGSSSGSTIAMPQPLAAGISPGMARKSTRSKSKSKPTLSPTVPSSGLLKTRLQPPGSSFRRPISAPNNVDGECEDPKMQEAQINAAFMGNNLKMKKCIKQSVAAGNLKSSEKVHTFTLQDFTIREQIGKGAFARVHVVKFNRLDYPSPTLSSKQFSKAYAIKSLRKADIVKTKQIKHVMSEKNILAMLKSPFVVELITTFQDSKHLYLEPVARFYTVEIVLALEYIHSQDVIYRDLKPENILICPRGHIKIADFGFAKVVPRNHATTFCGTPAYMAPEIILKQGYNKAADWWSLGTVCFELMAGYSPFQAESPLKIYERILNYELRWSSQIGETGRDLLARILEPQPSKRLGVNGAKDIKAHAWFAKVNWGDAGNLNVPVPFVPNVEGEGDIKNFDVYMDQSSVITMQNGTMAVTSEDNLYDGMFPDF
ncbi:camp-dependent protein kinase catalytic subunit [Podochytrium sp. JEL0797]|nr:camp-dependent protein kinase catalytic subunit [Podochytrium sp. JEL0797]